MNEKRLSFITNWNRITESQWKKKKRKSSLIPQRGEFSFSGSLSSLYVHRMNTCTIIKREWWESISFPGKWLWAFQGSGRWSWVLLQNLSRTWLVVPTDWATTALYRARIFELQQDGSGENSPQCWWTWLFWSVKVDHSLWVFLSNLADSRSNKVSVKRIPTTVMLDRARHRLSTVITGLISQDRRLTQRIVELARDPNSYFGNLVRNTKVEQTSSVGGAGFPISWLTTFIWYLQVKEHRSFTLESMSNHSSSTELLQEIRQMVTQLKSYLLQSTELHCMLEPQHQYTQDKLGKSVLFSSVTLCANIIRFWQNPLIQSSFCHINMFHLFREHRRSCSV